MSKVKGTTLPVATFILATGKAREIKTLENDDSCNRLADNISFAANFRVDFSSFDGVECVEFLV